MTEQEEFTKLVLDGWTVKQLQEKYNLSRSAIYARKTKWGLTGLSPNNKKLDHESGVKICTSCKEEKPLSDFYSNGYQPNGKRKYKGKCVTCENTYRYDGFQEKIETALRELGKLYSCEVCGYDRNTAALCFHHTDPTQKDIELSSIPKTSSIEIIKAEIGKCIVLCHNCHMEEHYPHLNR